MTHKISSPDVQCDCVLCMAARVAEAKKIPHPKRNPGRQSLPKDERLIQIQARVKPDLWAWYFQGAQKRGLTLSQFVAMVLEQYRETTE